MDNAWSSVCIILGEGQLNIGIIPSPESSDLWLRRSGRTAAEGGAGASHRSRLSEAGITRSCRGHLLAEAELAAVDPQAVQDGRELAGHRHLGPPHASALG